jgi:soluble lytic murein transglycosylase-like protein/TolA-binding protein
MSFTFGCVAKDRKDLASSERAVVQGQSFSFTSLLQNLDDMPLDDVKAQLRALVSAPRTNSEVRQEAAYVLGHVLQREGNNEDLQEAIQLYERAAGIPSLRERCQWHVAECATNLGDEQAVRDALFALTDKAGDRDLQASAAYRIAQSFLRSNEKGRAEESFALIRKKFPGSEFDLGSAYYLAELYAGEADKQDKATKLFREYLKASPAGHFAPEIMARLASLEKFALLPTDHELFASVHYARGEWQAALEEWAKSGGSEHWLERANCLIRINRLKEARQLLEAGVKNHLNDDALPEAARSLCQMLSHDEAISLWKSIAGRSTRFADLALWNLGIRSEPPQSVNYYSILLKKYPQSEFAPECAWWTFWDQVKHGSIRPALEQALVCERKYVDKRLQPRFSFWAGKLFEKLNKKDSAIAQYRKTAAEYPSSYYGWRAKGRLCALTGGKDSGWSTNPARCYPCQTWNWPAPPGLFSYQEIAKSASATIATLVRLHQWEESLDLLPTGASSTLRAFLMAKVNQPLQAINTMSIRLSGKPEDNGQWQMAYPLLYSPAVSEAARQQGIDPLLVHALIREESRYNHLAVSRSNALGLMQLLPGTAYGVAKRIGLALQGQSDIRKPENNIKLGTNYLAYVIKRHQGNALLGVASYNGGPNAALAWAARMKTERSQDWDSFVENIPFKETRDYVRKVFTSFWNYQAIYSPVNGHQRSIHYL